MSQVAGRTSVRAGATALKKEHGGRGVLLGKRGMLNTDPIKRVHGPFVSDEDIEDGGFVSPANHVGRRDIYRERDGNPL